VINPHKDIDTERLTLRALTPEEYQLLEKDSRSPLVWEGKDFIDFHTHLENRPSPLGHRIPRIKANPEFAPFALRLAIDKNSRYIIGSAGFHTLPDENGMIEIGIGVEEQYRNQGYATEILLAMWRWVLGDERVKTLRYTVAASNIPSITIINKFKFIHVGQQIDEEDGPEEIYEISAVEFKQRFID
jgi:RimJ/RimL family protein N-acetyltransferase